MAPKKKSKSEVSAATVVVADEVGRLRTELVEGVPEDEALLFNKFLDEKQSLKKKFGDGTLQPVQILSLLRCLQRHRGLLVGAPKKARWGGEFVEELCGTPAWVGCNPKQTKVWCQNHVMTNTNVWLFSISLLEKIVSKTPEKILSPEPTGDVCPLCIKQASDAAYWKGKAESLADQLVKYETGQIRQMCFDDDDEENSSASSVKEVVTRKTKTLGMKVKK